MNELKQELEIDVHRVSLSILHIHMFILHLNISTYLNMLVSR